MTYYTLKASDFKNPEDAIKICSRMGWALEQDSNEIKTTIPNEDANLFEFIFDYFIYSKNFSKTS